MFALFVYNDFSKFCKIYNYARIQLFAILNLLIQMFGFFLKIILNCLISNRINSILKILNSLKLN